MTQNHSLPPIPGDGEASPATQRVNPRSSLPGSHPFVTDQSGDKLERRDREIGGRETHRIRCCHFILELQASRAAAKARPGQ